jgi:thymidylate synthase
MRQYCDLVQHILDTGTRKENRTGVDTISTFGYYYEHDMDDGFPLLTTKEISWKNIVIENLWFLSGDKTIDFLKRHGCKFWDAWAEPENRNEVPSAYGNFWRHFPLPGVNMDRMDGVFSNDQIAWVLAEMKKNPMSRRMVVSAWAPGNAQTSKLPPCHCLFAFNVQNEVVQGEQGGTVLDSNFDENGAVVKEVELHRKFTVTKKRLCLHLTQRSCDAALGIPYNLAGYAFILQLFAQLSGLEPGIFGHTLIDAHIYTSKPNGDKAEYDHIPGLKEQIARKPRPLPRLRIDPSIKDLSDVEALLDPSVTTEDIMRLFVLEGYDPHPALKFKVAV